MQERILDSTYRLLEEIGRGGFGAVWRAVRLGAEGSGTVAIKLLSRGNVPTLQDQLRFQREATLMSQLLHPGTVTVYELGESEGRAYIVMEYVDGPNLRDYVRSRGGRLPLSEILEILIQAAEALEYVHGHNIVHRDIKPQNILVATAKDSPESKVQIKIVDFGVARLNDPVRPISETNKVRPEVVGTLIYMAPESTGMVNWPIDSRADIYSLGIVAYELVSGRTPFQEFRNDELLRAHMETQPPSFSKFEDMRVPAVLERIVMKCIEKRPEDRYQSMFGLLADLRRMLENLRSQSFDEFEIASRDIALSRLFNNIFVGRGELVDKAINIIEQRQRKARVTWSMIRSSVGLGRTRCLTEVRRRLDERAIASLHIRFTESEQRLPLRALSLAVNEKLQDLEVKAPHAFQTLMEEMALIAGNGVTDVARLIPALRPHLLKSTQESTHGNLNPAMSIEDGEDDFDNDSNIYTKLQDFEYSSHANELYKVKSKAILQISPPIQQIFAELLGKLANYNNYLVFLLDDLHLADSQSIALFQFISERVNDQANFAFVMTIREGLTKTNFVLENFLIRLSNLRRRYHNWDLAPLTQYDVQQFLQAVGVSRPTHRFVEFVTAKCEGSPLLMQQLLKQMVESEALLPERRDFNPWAPLFKVDWTKLSRIVVDTRSIEGLLASLDRLDKRDQRLTEIAAVSHEACEFEYFRVEPDFTSVELETRLMSLQRRGVFEIIGDDELPVQRRAFVFSHEKLRSAILSSLDLQKRRQIHLAIANRIIQLYPKPRKERIFSLAKHFEGAGTLADAERASAIFLKAAQLHARNFEHTLAKYYTERAMQRASTIPNQQERSALYREVFETEYTIHIAQNELVEASDVCQQLVALTFDPPRKEVLQLHWAYLLLGLGRYRMAFSLVAEALDRKMTFPFGKVQKYISNVSLFLAEIGLFPVAMFFLQSRFFRKEFPAENQIQGLMYITLAQAHGADGASFRFLIAAIRMNLHRKGPLRSLAVFNMLLAMHYMRFGMIDRAFKVAEALERDLESRGRVDIARWVRALRLIWIDYPMGRVERLARVLDQRKEGQLPPLGVLNIESNALRSWIRTTSPRIWRSRRATVQSEEGLQNWTDKLKMHPGGYVADRAGKMRKISQKNPPAEFNEQADFFDEESNGNNSHSHIKVQVSRKMREAAENGQYVGLNLFSDALRFALSDKIDPLRRIVEQFARQRPGTIEGEIFRYLSLSLQEFSSGLYKESLDFYAQALRFFIRRSKSEISLPVSDAMRTGFIILPLFAFSNQTQGWPWGRSLARVLRRIDHSLLESESVRNPRRTPTTALYEGVVQFLDGQRPKALKILGDAKDIAKSSQNDLIACMAQQFMGLVFGDSDQVRAIDYLAECYRTSHDLSWRFMERQLLALCRRLSLPLQHHFPALIVESEKINFRRRAAGVAVSHIIESWLVIKREPQTVTHYIGQSVQMAAKILSSPVCLLFARSGDEKGALRPAYQWIDEGNIVLQDLAEVSQGAKALEAELVRNLPRFHDEDVRLIELEGKSIEQRKGQFWRPDKHTSSYSQTDSEHSLADADGTMQIDAMQTQHTSGEFLNVQPQQLYAVYFALKAEEKFYGWLAIGRVALSQFTSHDAELELMMLAKHAAFNMKYEQELQDKDANHKKLSLAHFAPAECALPDGITLEPIGRQVVNHEAGTQIYSIGSSRVLMLSWQFVSEPRKIHSEHGSLFRHYTHLLIEALRLSGDAMSLERFALRFSSDVGGILEKITLNQRFERVRITAILVDMANNEAQECVFGQEQMSFAGYARIERELLLELNGVLRLDRLVYRERRRLMAGNRYAWLMSFDPRFREVVPQFSRNGFLDDYINLRRSRGADLSRVLSGGELPSDFTATALIFDAVSSTKTAA